MMAVFRKIAQLADGHQLIREGASYANINMRMSSAILRAKFEKAGLTNIKVIDKKIPMGRWPEDRKHRVIGTCQLECFQSGIEAFSQAIFCRYLGTRDEMQVLLAQVRNDVKTRSFHWYWPL